MRRFPPKGTPEWCGPIELRPLILRIFEDDPGAAAFEPCDCGVTLIILSPKYVHPTEHYRVNPKFLEEARRLIKSITGLQQTCDDDGVLILAERV